MAISPQGYKIGGAPEAQNPFWGDGEDQSVDKIYATASIDNRTGVPGVVTTKHVSGNDITFDFAFHNLKGETGPQGPAGETGPQGPAGPGVVAGGTAGQVLTKVDNTDYNTEWKDATGGNVKVKYARSLSPSLENIPARGKITISSEDYVYFENASNVIPVMTSLKIQAGTNDLIVAGIRAYTYNNTLSVEVDVYNASSSAYNTSSYPNSPNNVYMTWLVLLI